MDELPYINTSPQKNDRGRREKLNLNMNSECDWKMPDKEIRTIVQSSKNHVEEEEKLGEESEEGLKAKHKKERTSNSRSKKERPDYKSESPKKNPGRTPSRKAKEIGDFNINIITIKNQVNKNYVIHNYH